MSDNNIYISSSPHFAYRMRTQCIMCAVLIALFPECVAGCILFGWKAAVAILVSAISAVVFEALFQKITKQKVLVYNLSAAVTGVMLALVCPPTTPIWILVLGSAFAVIVAKGLFGGIGSNVFNPALTGRAFLFISFPSVMGAQWLSPFANGNYDAVSSATVLSALKSGTKTTVDYLQYFIGNTEGCIGETSVLLIIISFIFLLVTKMIDWRAPLGMIGTVVICSFISGLIGFGNLWGAGNEILVNLLTGGLAFGACFMITDYATAPITKPGRLIFGAGAGLITFLIRKFGGYPEGVMFSILIMNAVAPFLNNVTSRMYGYGKKGNRHPDTSKISMEFDLKNAKKEGDNE